LRGQWPADRYWDSFHAELTRICGVLLDNVYALGAGPYVATEAWLPRHPVPAADLARVGAEVERLSEPLAGALPDGLPPGAVVVAVAGTATTLAALELALDPYDDERVEGFPVEVTTLRAWTERLARLGVAERKQPPGLEPGRART
jgi:exopolyphosphatase/guanosine-5'-triphosphate,3'-diphosphate pyrophosphatase